MLAILGRMVFQRGFNFVYLWGGMGAAQQEMCIRAFQQEPSIKIMVSPQRCKVLPKASPSSKVFYY